MARDGAGLDEVWRSQPGETLTGALIAAAEQVPSQPYLVFDERTLTYGELRDEASRMAAGLAALGIGAGDRVASLLDNRVEAVVTWFAAAWLGAVHQPINTANRGTFLTHQLEDSGAEVVVVSPQLLERIAEVAGHLSTLRHVVVTSDGDPAAQEQPIAASLATSGSTAPVSPYSSLFESGSLPPAPVRPADLTTLLYTSGTTGPSKGCMISHNYICHGGRTVLWSIQRQQHEVQWSCLPLFHMHAMAATVTATLLLQGTSVVGPKFSVSGFWPAIERSGASITYVIGPMAKLLADAPDSPEQLRCRGQLRVVRGAPFLPESVRAWRERFGVHEVCVGGYGLTEASPVVSMPYEADAPVGSSGRAAPDFDVRIFDEDDRELPPGQVGEVVVRPKAADIMFSGYWNRPADTLERWRNGWFHTGDLGSIDEDGWFTFADRKKDCLRRRGENISSFEVEAAALQHPAVADVAVHAVPSPLTEDDVKVTAVLRPGAELDEAELWRWMCQQVPDYARPRYIEFREDLPRNAVGRVLKFQLRDEGATPTTWDAEAHPTADTVTAR